MTKYVADNTIGVSKDTQLRMLKIFKVVLEDRGKGMFEFAHGIMKNRWYKLRNVLAQTDRFSLQNTSASYCTFFHKEREYTPAFAWLKCEKEEDENCYEVLRSGNIIGRKGDIFNADNRYVRLSLIGLEDDFNSLLNHLRNWSAPSQNSHGMEISTPDLTHLCVWIGGSLHWVMLPWHRSQVVSKGMSALLCDWKLMLISLLEIEILKSYYHTC
ncbi:hypothetical protein CRG98_044147 [Punica granatum]|uniref:Alliinase C-terminal domain-containing protein n=1 Tax=Punica granatum TaxID=22663 RepID=A0A2I0HUS9_PUNGR|nr:hypothetical protein CRG98_044147 [Punica granatum]